MSVNLSKEERVQKINLRKTEVVNLCKANPILDGLVSRVALVLDYSGSMRPLYENGTVQEVIESILPLAMQFDDNGEMECWLFHDGFFRLPSVTLDNFYGYIKENTSNKHMGGTAFAPVLKDISHKYLKEEPANLPTYVLFITDGENSDRTEATRVIKDLSKSPIFIQFVGIGSCPFDYLRTLDEMQGRYVDNANFFAVSNPDSITYTQLLKEYPSWLSCQKVKDMLVTQGSAKRTGFFRF